MNEAEIRAGYKEHHGREMSDDDYAAFLRMAQKFGASGQTYETVFNQIRFRIDLAIDIHSRTGERTL